MLRFLLCLIVFVESKQITQTFTMRQLQKTQTVVINKFGSKGVVNYKITSRLLNVPKDYEQKEFQISINFFQQDRWEEATPLPECSKDKQANRISTLNLKSNEEISMIEGQLVFGRYHNIWYVALNNCQHTIDKIIKLNNRNTKLEITVWLFEESGQEFSLEENGILSVVAILTVFSIIGFYYNFRLFKNEYDKYGEYDYAYLFVLIIIGLEAIQNTLHFFHLIVYNSNGKGIGAFVVLSEIIQVLDNYLLMILLILIAWGWSIEFIDIEDWDLYGPLAFLIAFAQALIVGLGKLVSSATQFHVYEGWVGYSISGIYITLALYFYYSANQRKKKGQIIESFYFQFKVYGILFFIAFPTLLFISKLMDPYKSYKIMIFGNLFARMLSIVLLTRLFTGKASDYKKICIKGKSILDRGKTL